MNTLRLGTRGSFVASLQNWYANFEPILADGDFGPETERITRQLQERFGLEPDGVLGPRTAGEFMRQGWLPEGFEQPRDEGSPFPVPPAAYQSLTVVEKKEKFGNPGTIPTHPTPGGPIQVDPAFKQRVVTIDLRPWFPGIIGENRVNVHAQTERQWRSLFDRIKEAGLADRILSCAGSWVPRLVRGSVSTLSSHAFATAIDFNAPENWLNVEPARRGRKGSLVEIVELLPEYKIYWGGWFGRVDGMHFECTATDAEVGF